MEDQIEEILKLTRENNKILRGMRSSQRWSSFFSFVYYVFIVAMTVGAYYYVQPLIDSLAANYEKTLSDLNSIKDSLPNSDKLNLPKETMDQLKNILNLEQ